MKIYPAILSDSVAEIQHQLFLAQDFENVETVQIDILDGRFADNMTVTPVDLVNLNFGELTVDFHLMVDEPMDYIQEILNFQEELPVRAVVAQIERMSCQEEVLQKIKKNKLIPGLSLDLFTPVESIDWSNAEDLEIIQLMAIEAGFQGQEFQSAVLDKIEKTEDKLSKHKLETEIVVDGGIKLKQAEILSKAGVDAAAIGSLIWESDDPAEIIEQINSSSFNN